MKPLEILKQQNIAGISVPLEIVTHLVQVKGITIIHTTGPKTIASTRQLSQFEAELVPYRFKKVNSNTLVNPAHIDYISNKQIIVLTDGSEIEIEVGD